MRKPFGDDGHEIDALYSVERRSDGFDLIVESRGGSDHGPNKSRSKKYAPAMELHLHRMGELGMTLQELQVASGPAMKLPEEQRGVDLDRFSLPLDLSSVPDVVGLRHSIGRASAAFSRTDGSDRGNRTKRMRLRIRWSGAAGMSAREIEQLLAKPGTSARRAEVPTADPDELFERAHRALKRFRHERRNERIPPPPGQTDVPRSTADIARFVRDPNVIAWVLNAAQGRCEVCDDPAPFLRSGGEPYLEVHHVLPLSQG
ncbi:hypothetical protein [Roseivivax halodurans]|uniref:hypothetical protein n=1 Tax=Roseivivax halodurans TaxID=93683 RepID=UPI0012F86B4C|nr:hypothetical protein [Roseivivax halodurans]